MTDLTNHFAYGPEEGFEENGHTIKGWQPANDEALPVMVVQAYKDGKLVKEASSPMFHPNQWGVDAEDVAAFEKITDELINSLPEGE